MPVKIVKKAGLRPGCRFFCVMEDGEILYGECISANIARIIGNDKKLLMIDGPMQVRYAGGLVLRAKGEVKWIGIPEIPNVNDVAAALKWYAKTK